MIVVLTGGTGGAKFVQGLKQVVPARELTLVVNTGDDLWWRGLYVAPDLDSITYALADLLSRKRGWGLEGDTFACLEMMDRLAEDTWFQVGDRDLAVHLLRTALLADGLTLAQATAELAGRLGIEARILPMTNQPVETRILSERGELSFQEYFVRERYQVRCLGVRFEGIEQAELAPGVREAIRAAEAVLLAPSNPVTSIGPILAVRDIREALRETPAPVGAVSPIVGEKAFSGPAGDLMRAQGLPVSVEGVARSYADFLDVVVADEEDRARRGAVERLGLRVHFAQTKMRSRKDKVALARAALEATRRLPVA